MTTESLSDNDSKSDIQKFVLLIKEREMVAYKTGERIRVYDVMEKCSSYPKIIHRVVVNSQNQALRHDEFDRTVGRKKPRNRSAYVSSSGKIRYHWDLSHWGEVVNEHLLVAKELVIQDEDYDKWARVKPTVAVSSTASSNHSKTIPSDLVNSDGLTASSNTQLNNVVYESSKIQSTNSCHQEEPKVSLKLSNNTTKSNGYPSNYDYKWLSRYNGPTQSPRTQDEWCPYITDDKEKGCGINQNPYDSFLTITGLDKQPNETPRAPVFNSNDPLTLISLQQKNYSESFRDAISFGMGSSLASWKTKSKRIDLNPPIQNNSSIKVQPGVYENFKEFQKSYTDGYQHNSLSSSKTKQSKIVERTARKKNNSGSSVDDIPQTLMLLNSVNSK